MPPPGRLRRRCEAALHGRDRGVRAGPVPEHRRLRQPVLPEARRSRADARVRDEPYHGLSKRAFTVRVGILTGSDKPQICLRIIRLEAQEEDMAEEFKECLNATFDDGDIKVFIGQG